MKGVSPIISAILMIAIAIAAAVIVYYVTMDIVSSTGSNAENQATAGQDMIQIEGLSSWNSGSITAYVYNAGDQTVHLQTAYILDASGNVVCGPQDISSNTVSAKDTQKVTITFSSCSLTSGDTYTLKIVSKNGGVATKSFTAP
jgi:flagellin-like protein